MSGTLILSCIDHLTAKMTSVGEEPTPDQCHEDTSEENQLVLRPIIEKNKEKG